MGAAGYTKKPKELNSMQKVVGNGQTGTYDLRELKADG
jgi:hypothetical protein